jgi:hypothetical protein
MRHTWRSTGLLLLTFCSVAAFQAPQGYLIDAKRHIQSSHSSQWRPRAVLPSLELSRRLSPLLMSSNDEIAELEARLAKLRAAEEEEEEEEKKKKKEEAEDEKKEEEVGVAAATTTTPASLTAEEATARAEEAARQRLSDYRKERTIGGVSLGEGEINRAIEGTEAGGGGGGDGGGLVAVLQTVAAVAAAAGLVAFSQVPVGTPTTNFGVTAENVEKNLETPEQIRARYSATEEASQKYAASSTSGGDKAEDDEMVAIEARIAELKKIKDEAAAAGQ